jgi:iron complex outermembrane receptor protein
MRYLKHLLLISVVAFWLLPESGYSQFKVSGTVFDKESGKPLPGATVTMDDSGISTITGSDGHFLFKNIEKGMHTIFVRYMGYKSTERQFELSQDVILNFSLESDVIMSDEFIVTSTRVSEKSPTTYSELSKSEIEKNNTGQDLPYLIALTPSVVTTSDAGSGVGYTGIRIRGTDITGINVTMNGVPVNDPESHSVYFVDLPDLASSINSIQIQRGVGTSTNGSAAFGASINIQTTKLNPDPYVELSSNAGSYNTFKNTMNFGSGLLNGKWAFDGRLSAISSDGYIERGWSDLKSFYVSGGYFGSKTIVKAIVSSGKEKTYQAWYGTPKDSLKTNRRYNPSGIMYDEDGNITGYYDNQTDNYTQTHYQLHLVQNLGNNFHLTAATFYTKGKGYYESYKNSKKFSSYGFNNVIIGGDTITRTNLIQQKWLDNDFYGINAALNYESKKLEATFGGGWNSYSGDHFGYIVWAQYAGSSFVDKPWYENTGDKTDYNIFGKANYHINDVISIYADLQYRGITYDMKGIDDDLRDLTQSHTFSFFNPKAGLYFELNKQNGFYISTAVANREPSRSVYKDADPGQIVKPEKLIDYELGYNFKSKFVALETNLYFMDYKDQLVLTGQINNVGTPIKVNVPHSYRTGIEITAGFKISKSLKWDINATISRNKIKDFTEYVDNWNYWDDPANQPFQFVNNIGETDISFSPNYISGSNLEWKAFEGFSVNLISQYVGRQYIDNTSNTERSLDPYFVNNLRLSYSIKTKFIKQIDFSLNLNNFLNEEYETNAWVYRYVYDGKEGEMNGYFPQAEFNVMCGVSLKF